MRDNSEEISQLLRGFGDVELQYKDLVKQTEIKDLAQRWRFIAQVKHSRSDFGPIIYVKTSFSYYGNPIR